MSGIEVTMTTTRRVQVEPLRQPLHLGFDLEYRVIYAGWGAAPRKMLAEVRYLIGEPAELLYQAITGHPFDAPASAASLERALDARGEALADRRLNSKLMPLALRVLVHYEDHLQPGLGQVQLDRQGRLLSEPAVITLPELAL
ncbi:MAG: hypothetical protein FOGNACKC_02264 [Anaerolineae bacterium]|nr:hypothetical protein [Anaerolineae bacterium]